MYKTYSKITVISILFFSIVFPLSASEYPERPIEAISPYAAGSSADASARIFSEFMSRYLGRSFIVINKPGGGGAIAGNALAKSKPDGYTTGLFNIAQPTPETMVNPERYTYKSGDIIPVAQFQGNANPGIFVRYDAPWKSIQDFIQYVKKNPDKIKWGHNGKGGNWWVLGRLLIEKAGDLKMKDVPFQGDGQEVAALLGNHIDVAILACGGVNIGHIEAKQIRALLQTRFRIPQMPDVPTDAEAGYPMDLPDAYYGVFVPKGTSKEVIVKIGEATRKVTEDSQYKEKMKHLWIPVVYKDAKELQESIDIYAKFKYNTLKRFGML